MPLDHYVRTTKNAKVKWFGISLVFTIDRTLHDRLEM